MHVFKNKGVPFTQNYNFITKPLCSSIYRPRYQITCDILFVKYLNSFPYAHTIRNALFSSVHMAINNNLVHIKTMREAFLANNAT